VSNLKNRKNFQSNLKILNIKKYAIRAMKLCGREELPEDHDTPENPF
jgi:hypothetical protein